MDRWDAPWGRGQMGGWDAFPRLIAWVCTADLHHFARNKTKNLATFLGALFPPVFSHCVSHFRPNWKPPISSSGLGLRLLTWLCLKRQGLKPGHYVLIALLVVATIIGLDVMLTHRDDGLGGAEYSLEDFSGVRVDNNFYSLGATIHLVPDEASFVGFGELEYVIVRPIPRVFWPNKPMGPGFDLAEQLRLKGVALSITSIGEWYIGFGWFGIFVGGALLGWLAVWWSQFLEVREATNSIALYGFGTMVLFLSIRSLLEMVLMTYPIVCWWALNSFTSRAKRSQNTNDESPLPATVA